MGHTDHQNLSIRVVKLQSLLHVLVYTAYSVLLVYRERTHCGIEIEL